MKKRAPKKRPAPNPPRLIVVASDIHFPHHSPPHWASFRAFHRANRPHRTILLGDMLDLLPMSTHPKKPEDETEIASSIEMFVRECNELASECGELVCVIGNHERRFERYLRGAAPHVIRGLRGLSLREQARSFGLRKDIAWVEEDAAVEGVRSAQFLCRHGDQQAGRFGGSLVNTAGWILNRSYAQSAINGHFHRAGIYVRTLANGTNFHGVANPCLAANTYAPGAEWSRGFTILETIPPDHARASVYLVTMEPEGSFVFGGKYYTSSP